MQRCLKLKGYVTVTIRTSTTSTVVYSGPNLILNTGVEMLPKLLGQTSSSPSDLRITNIIFGDDNSTPVYAQTGIQGNEVFTSAITTYTEAVGGVAGLMEVEAVLAGGEGNGFTIREVALGASDGTVFARQVIQDIVKTLGTTVTVNWRVQFIAD